MIQGSSDSDSDRPNERQPITVRNRPITTTTTTVVTGLLVLLAAAPSAGRLSQPPALSPTGARAKGESLRSSRTRGMVIPREIPRARAATPADAATAGKRRGERRLARITSSGPSVASCWVLVGALAAAAAAVGCCCRSSIPATIPSVCAFASLSLSSRKPAGVHRAGGGSPATPASPLFRRQRGAALIPRSNGGSSTALSGCLDAHSARRGDGGGSSSPAFVSRKCASCWGSAGGHGLWRFANKRAPGAGGAARQPWARRRGDVDGAESFGTADDEDEDDLDFDLEYDEEETTPGRADGDDDDDAGDLLGMMDGVDDEPVDVPDNWTEQDILAELGDDLVVDDVGVESVDPGSALLVNGGRVGRRQGRQAPVSSASRSSVRAANSAEDEDGDGDDDDDDLDLDDIDVDLDLDEEDDDEEGTSEYDAEEDEASRQVVGSADLDDGSWEDDGDDDEDEGDYSLLLQDDLDDPNERRLDEIVSEAVDAGEREARSRAFNPVEFLQRRMTPDQRQELDRLPFLKAVQERARSLQLVEQDVAQLDLEQGMNEVSDLMLDDPYPSHSDDELNVLEQDVGVTDAEMEALDDAYKEMTRIIEREPWDKVTAKDAQPGVWDTLPQETQEEMAAALEELGGSSYNATRWLLYDLDFNVTNLMLAAVKHNAKAPVLLQHWYPQLATYSRYQSARDRNFDFTWEDVENADVQELQKYYAGFGYDEIPKKAPAETGLIGFEELDEEEIKMAAFENWMTQVYNPEWDRTDFDDDDMRDEDNVFSEFYDPPQHPDLPAFEDSVEDIEGWNEQLDGEESEYKLPPESGSGEGIDAAEEAYRNMMGQKFEYEVVRDPEFQREFRGHLIVACTGSDHDLEVAEKITERFRAEFGKQVYVETRLMALAREEDNVFEVWLESYEIDLLHSKKRATSNTQDWKGPAECDAAQIDYLVDRVRFLISDDARYSYRMDLEHVDA